MIHRYMRNYLNIQHILSILTLFLLYYQPESSHASDAFAQVARQLRSLETMSYTLKLYIQENDLFLSDFYIYYRYPQTTRFGSPAERVYSVDNHSTRKQIVIDRELNTYQYMDLANDPSMGDIDEWHSALIRFPREYDEDLGEELIDGRSLHKYQVTFKNHLFTVWSSTEGTLVRVKYYDLSPTEQESQTYSILTDIRINPDLPDSLFDMTPPPGYSQVK